MSSPFFFFFSRESRLVIDELVLSFLFPLPLEVEEEIRNGPTLLSFFSSPFFFFKFYHIFSLFLFFLL